MCQLIFTNTYFRDTQDPLKSPLNNQVENFSPFPYRACFLSMAIQLALKTYNLGVYLSKAYRKD